MKAQVRHELLITLDELQASADRHDLLAFAPEDRQERALVGYNREVESKLLKLAEDLKAHAIANGVLGGGA